MRKLTTFLLLLAMLIPTAGAQSTDIFKKKKKKNSKTEAVDKAKADSIAKAKKSPFQPYASVITGKAKTMNGFFKVHCIEGKYFFEIPDSLFGRDILIVNRIVKAPVDKQKRKAGYPGDHISDEVIRFELGRDNKLFIRQILSGTFHRYTGNVSGSAELQRATYRCHLPAEDDAQGQPDEKLCDRNDRLYPQG